MVKPADALEVTYLPTTGHAASVGAMAFLAVLAYPNERRKRDMLIHAMKAGLLKSAVPQGKGRSALRDDLRTFPNRRIENVVGMAVKRIAGRRIPAARMLHWLILNGRQDFMRVSGEYPRTINAAARVLDAWQPGEESTGNIKHRVWSESKPVIHLAHAYWTTVHWNAKPSYLQPGGSVDVWRLIQRPDWLPDVLERAERTRRALPLHNPALKISEAELIRLLPE